MCNLCLYISRSLCNSCLRSCCKILFLMSKYTGGSPTIQCTPYKRKSLRSKFSIEHRSSFQKQARTFLQRGIFLGKLWQEYPLKNVYLETRNIFSKEKLSPQFPPWEKVTLYRHFPLKLRRGASVQMEKQKGESNWQSRCFFDRKSNSKLTFLFSTKGYVLI